MPENQLCCPGACSLCHLQCSHGFNAGVERTIRNLCDILFHQGKRKQVSGISQLVELVKAQSVDQQAAMASRHVDKMQRLDGLLYILAKKFDFRCTRGFVFYPIYERYGFWWRLLIFLRFTRVF